MEKICKKTKTFCVIIDQVHNFSLLSSVKSLHVLQLWHTHIFTHTHTYTCIHLHKFGVKICIRFPFFLPIWKKWMVRWQLYHLPLYIVQIKDNTIILMVNILTRPKILFFGFQGWNPKLQVSSFFFFKYTDNGLF